MEDVEVSDQFPIVATSSRLDDHARVLKHGDTFAVFDQSGDIQPLGLGEQGLYHEGTRYLSRFKLSINGRQPLLLSSTVLEDNSLLTVDLTNPDLKLGEDAALSREVVHLLRSCFLWAGSCYAKVHVQLFSPPRRCRAAAGDRRRFCRHFRGPRHDASRAGNCSIRKSTATRCCSSYRGLDGVTRQTRISFTPTPDRLTATAAGFAVHLAAARGTRLSRHDRL